MYSHIVNGIFSSSFFMFNLILNQLVNPSTRLKISSFTIIPGMVFVLAKQLFQTWLNQLQPDDFYDVIFYFYFPYLYISKFWASLVILSSYENKAFHILHIFFCIILTYSVIKYPRFIPQQIVSISFFLP